jgi:alanine racemase
LWCVVHSLWQLEAIEQARLSKPLTVWLKLDSGMHRVGLHPKDYHDAYQRLLASGQVAKIVLMSHFARADELDCTSSDEQVAVFDAARQGLAAQVSLRNSPSVMGWPGVSSDWVRPGIMLYGATPFGEDQAVAERLQPVMTLESKVICVRELPAGEPVGYGARFVTPKPMRIGVVAMGYADGYPRHAPTGTPVLGRRPAQPVAGARVDGHAVCRPDRCARGRVWARPSSCGAKTSSPAMLRPPLTPFPTRFFATCAECHGSIPAPSCRTPKTSSGFQTKVL